MRGRVRLTGERFPEFGSFARRQAARRHLLWTREESHRHLYEIGVLSEKVFRQLEDEVVDELRSLRKIPVGTTARPDVAEFLRVIPLFADLTAEELEPLVSRMRTETYRPGSVIIDPEADPAGDAEGLGQRQPARKCLDLRRIAARGGQRRTGRKDMQVAVAGPRRELEMCRFAKGPGRQAERCVKGVRHPGQPSGSRNRDRHRPG